MEEENDRIDKLTEAVLYLLFREYGRIVEEIVAGKRMGIYAGGVQEAKIRMLKDEQEKINQMIRKIKE